MLGLELASAGAAFRALGPIARAALAAPDRDLARVLGRLRSASPRTELAERLEAEILRQRFDGMARPKRPPPTKRAGPEHGLLAGRLLREDGRISGCRFAGDYRDQQIAEALALRSPTDPNLRIQVHLDADAFLDRMLRKPTAGFSFDKDGGVIFLRKEASRLEWFHEYTHAKQFMQLGHEAYDKLGRWERELHVFETIMDHQSKFSLYEILRAKNHIRGLAESFKKSVPQRAKK